MRTSIGAAFESVAAPCPSNTGSQGILSRWRAICNALSVRDRTGILRRSGPVIKINEEALLRCEEKLRRRRSHGTPPELDAQQFAANSNRASRQSDRTRRRKKEQEARERTRDQRLVTSLLEGLLNPQDGNAQGQTVTFSTLHSWRQRGHVNAEFSEEIKNTQEKSQESREDSRFTGIVVGSEKEKGKKKRKIERVEEDGILLIVPTRINGKVFTALIDSGATRCFVTPECSTIAGLSCVPHDTFLELGNGARALSRGMVQGAPITLAGVTTRLDLTVSQLLHDVDIVLGINWLKSVNPLIDWCSGRVYMPGAIHTAFLEGTWLSSDHAVGTVKLLSTSHGLENITNESVRNSISI